MEGSIFSILPLLTLLFLALPVIIPNFAGKLQLVGKKSVLIWGCLKDGIRVGMNARVRGNERDVSAGNTLQTGVLRLRPASQSQRYPTGWSQAIYMTHGNPFWWWNSEKHLSAPPLAPSIYDAW